MSASTPKRAPATDRPERPPPERCRRPSPGLACAATPPPSAATTSEARTTRGSHHTGSQRTDRNPWQGGGRIGGWGAAGGRLVAVLLLLFASSPAGSAGRQARSNPVVELTGQTIQQAIHSMTPEWTNESDLAKSRFVTAYGVAFSLDGRTVYVGEAYKNRLLAVDVETGVPTTIAGGTRGLQDGPLAEAKFSWPYGVAVSPSGTTLYVADSGNDCVRAVDLAGGVVSTVAGGGTGSRGFQDGPAAAARFAWPYGVAVSPDGHTLYVADSGNNRVRSIDLVAGEVSTLAGAGNAGYADGAALSARFYGPRGVVAAPDGATVYVADYSNFRVRAVELDAAGGAGLEVTTLFGGGGEIYRPAGVAMSHDGTTVLAVDTANTKIRQVHVRESPLLGTASVGAPQPPPPPYAGKEEAPPPGGKSGASSFSWPWPGGLPPRQLGPGAPAYKGSRKVGLGAGAGEGTTVEIEQMHIRHAITAMALFVLMALLGAGGIVAAALWQRRNALLMLRRYQATAQHHSAVSIYAAERLGKVDYYSGGILHPEEGTGEVALDIPLLHSHGSGGGDDDSDGERASNASSASGSTRGSYHASLGAARAGDRHSAAAGGGLGGSAWSGAAAASVVRRTASSIWPAAEADGGSGGGGGARQLQSQRSLDTDRNGDKGGGWRHQRSSERISQHSARW